MADIDKQTVNTANVKNWKDNLLLKDETGLLSYYKKKDLTKSKSDFSTNNLVSEPSESKKSIDYNFVEDQNWKLKGKSGDKADFYFHPEDKRDLESLAKNVPKDESKKYSIEKIVAKIIEQQKLKFDQENKQKFTEALFNFFRSRKNAISTRQFIIEKVKSGERRLAEKSIDIIMSVVKGIKEKIIGVGGLVIWEEQIVARPLAENKAFKDDKLELKAIVLEEEEISGEPQAEIDKALAGLSLANQKTEEIVEISDEVKEDQGKKELKSKEEILRKDSSEDLVWEKKIKATEQRVDLSEKKDLQPAETDLKPTQKDEQLTKNTDLELEKTKQDFSIPNEEKSRAVETGFKEELLPKVSRPLATTSDRKNISDVLLKNSLTKAPKPVLTGPVQEIQSLDLLNFRRLGQSPQERVNKILEKINLLEHDSFTKKAQGIQAWRSSSLHQLYLSLGYQSMSEGKAIEDFLASKKETDSNHLDWEEFSLISDLNKQLRF